MKTTRFFVATLGLVAALAASPVFAQSHSSSSGQPPRQGAAPQIAVLDISRIFKEHPRFAEKMAELKSRVESADASMKRQADQLQQMAEELKTLKSGSQEYKAKEREIASRRAQMQIDIQSQRKDFLQQEAKIYKDIYETVKVVVDEYARSAGLAAVVRYASQPPEIDPNDPNVVLQDIKKDLVWFHPNLDITDHILAGLKSRSGMPTGRVGIPQQQPSRSQYRPAQNNSPASRSYQR